jgi:hypothetical protein
MDWSMILHFFTALININHFLMYQAGKTVSKSLNQGVVYATTVKVGALLNVMRPYTLKTTRGLNYSCKMKTCE